MPIVNDPQNPVHFVPNALIPTELDKTKVNYGLAQEIADGPETFDLGVVKTMPNPSATFPSGTPVNVPAVPPVTVFKTSPAGNPGKVPNIQNQGGSTNVGVLHPPPPRPIATTPLPAPTQPSGAVNLGGFLFVPEAGAKPENPA
jgi:hypothetical protein